jgi:hypothetical protein
MAQASFRDFATPVRAKAFLHKGVRSLTAATTITRPDHAGRTNLLSLAAGFTVTLPAAKGSGYRYRFVVGTALTSGTYIIKVANATDVFTGGVFINDTGDSPAATADFFPTAATSDTFTMTQSAGGGKKGDWFELEDFASGFFVVHGLMQGLADPATPFSATV